MEKEFVIKVKELQQLLKILKLGIDSKSNDDLCKFLIMSETTQLY